MEAALINLAQKLSKYDAIVQEELEVEIYIHRPFIGIPKQLNSFHHQSYNRKRVYILIVFVLVPGHRCPILELRIPGECPVLLYPATSTSPSVRGCCAEPTGKTSHQNTTTTHTQLEATRGAYMYWHKGKAMLNLFLMY